MRLHAEIEYNDVEPIVISTFLAGQTVTIRICRTSDGFFLDWSDDTFKSVGSVTTLNQALAAKDAVNAPGIYELASVNHPNGLDTSILSPLNTSVDDTYIVIPNVIGPPRDVTPGEIRVKCLVDGVLNRKTVASEVRAKLVGDVVLDPAPTPCPAVEATYKDAAGNDLFTHSNNGGSRTTVP